MGAGPDGTSDARETGTPPCHPELLYRRFGSLDVTPRPRDRDLPADEPRDPDRATGAVHRPRPIHQRRPGDDLETFGSDGTLSGALAAADPEHEILIEELELSVRSYNCLKRSAIQTVGDLIAKTENELNAIPNFGQKSIDEVIQTLTDRGLTLRGS